MYTGSQKTLLASTGKFKVLTDSKYLIKADYLRRGDIILGPGHTAIVLSDGELAYDTNIIKVNATDKAKSFLATLSGTYTVTATKLNIRHGAGTLKKVMAVLPKGAKVDCFGYYTKVLNTNWLYVQFIYKDTKYTGFASAKYLEKQ
jgi:hypothetical protein